ncbi:hypothetical protein OIE68_00920 [Nocardia vinacea]|uniref:Uncharacterized protein n=1 Tax=Nocardia vinacea TaxID=96468 RepID=A0ABZ1YLK5_9NOCA|nr:hypothetical protein OIE68_00920 [Nocardia vinacea]
MLIDDFEQISDLASTPLQFILDGIVGDIYLMLWFLKFGSSSIR